MAQLDPLDFQNTPENKGRNSRGPTSKRLTEPPIPASLVVAHTFQRLGFLFAALDPSHDNHGCTGGQRRTGPRYSALGHVSLTAAKPNGRSAD